MGRDIFGTRTPIPRFLDDTPYRRTMADTEGTQTSEHHDLRTEGRMSHDEFERRMKAARSRAQWEIGDPSWAGVIIAAFMEPESDERLLAEEMDS